MENGKLAILSNLKNGVGCGSTEFHVSRPYDLCTQEYLFYYFVQQSFRRKAQQNMTGSAGQLRVSKTYFEEVSVPLAPLNEQKRIVAKIEELFSELDKGLESLKTVRQHLKLYRQVALKWAFEGKLTKPWRKEQANKKKTTSGTEKSILIEDWNQATIGDVVDCLDNKRVPINKRKEKTEKV